MALIKINKWKLNQRLKRQKLKKDVTVFGNTIIIYKVKINEIKLMEMQKTNF